MKKETGWKKTLQKLEEEFGVSKNIKPDWSGSEQYGLWLPFIDQEDLFDTMKHLVKWRDFHSFKYIHDDHRHEKKMFEYFPVEQKIVLKPKMTETPGDMHIIGIKIKMGMRFI